LRILFIGDIFGRPGRTIVRKRLKQLVADHAVDLTIANGENSAAGFGITGSLAEELFDMGIDVITTGNHIWDNARSSNISKWLPAIRTVQRGAYYAQGTFLPRCRAGDSTKARRRLAFPTR